MQVIIRFPDAETEKVAFERLIGRFTFKSWQTGEMMLPAEALPFLAAERIKFQVEGPATYEHYAPVRSLAAA
jgi:hypothetical protein